MSNSTDGPQIVHAREENRFVYRAGDAGGGGEAELVYHLNGHRLVLLHTEVPDGLAGRGLGGHLVTAALEWAEREGLTIVPWCPFARAWLERHPGAVGPVDVDWESTRPAST